MVTGDVDETSPALKIPACQEAPMFFSPFAILFFFFFLLGFILLFALVQVGLISIAFAKIGLSPSQVFGFLMLSLLGSYINIPVRKISVKPQAIPPTVRAFGIKYKIPSHAFQGSVIAINLGGALIPLFLSAYLMLKWHLFLEPVMGISIVAILCYLMARPVPGVGIALPLFVPPLLAALVAIIISPGIHAPVVAYISGTMGTLIGADIMHLKDVKKLYAPVVSIGGAGTFDGIFLTGIIAVLLA